MNTLMSISIGWNKIHLKELRVILFMSLIKSLFLLSLLTLSSSLQAQNVDWEEVETKLSTDLDQDPYENYYYKGTDKPITGKIFKYDETKSILEETFEVKNGKKHGIHLIQAPNGKPIVKSTYTNNLLHGQLIEFHDNGKLEIIANYRYEKQHGPRRTYRKDGSLNSIISYVNNKNTGIDIYFYPDGTISQTNTMANGSYAGIQTFYYKNGRINIMGEMFGGDKQGEWIKYNEDGTVRERTSH